MLLGLCGYAVDGVKTSVILLFITLYHFVSLTAGNLKDLEACDYLAVASNTGDM